MVVLVNSVSLNLCYYCILYVIINYFYLSILSTSDDFILTVHYKLREFITVKEELAAVSFLSLDPSLLARISAWCQLAMKFLVVYEWISELANHGDGVPISELKWTVKWTEWPITTTESCYIFGTYFMNENQWSNLSVLLICGTGCQFFRVNINCVTVFFKRIISS